MVLLAGCAKPVPSEQPGTSAPTEDSVQVPTSGSATLPVQTQPVSNDVPQIPRQNTLQSGNPQTLSDWVFTNYEQTFSWRDSVNNFCSVSITLPALAPVTDFAIRFNEEIWELGSAYVEEAVQCRKQETSNILSRVTYEAYLYDEILSIVLIENTTFDYTAYRSWSFDLEDRQALSTAELADELLDMDYPEFILASNAITAHHFKEQYGRFIANMENQQTSTDSYFETEPPAELELYHALLEQIPYDTVSIQNRRLFVGENGQVMLIYDAPSLAGASFYPTVIPFDLTDVDWKIPTEETAYGELLRLTEYVDGAYAESYASILVEVFFADSEDFVKYTAKATATRQEDITSFLNYGLQPQQVERFQSICRELLKEDDLSESETALLNRLVTLSGN
jgi:hypothetical protein